jgi:L-ectoine synthase
MKVVTASYLRGTDREVDCPKGGFKSLRILLESDGMGYTLTETHIPQGEPQRWHYKGHLETCYCVSGMGILTDEATGEQWRILPGMAYVLDKHDAHTFQGLTDVVLVCVFNPPLKGKEVHKEDGSY